MNSCGVLGTWRGLPLTAALQSCCCEQPAGWGAWRWPCAELLSETIPAPETPEALGTLVPDLRLERTQCRFPLSLGADTSLSLL